MMTTAIVTRQRHHLVLLVLALLPVIAAAFSGRALGRSLGLLGSSKLAAPLVDLRMQSTSSSSSSSSGEDFQNHLRGADLKNRFFALRHGQSLANVAGIIASDPAIACQQYGLSEVGKDQAKAAGLKLVSDFVKARNEDPSLRGIAIVSSDLLRAKETAQLSADAIADYNNNNNNNAQDNTEDVPIALYNDAIVIDTRLRERGFGDWDGGSDVHYTDVWKDDAIDPHHTLRNVESVWSVTDRASRLVVEWDQNLSIYYWIVCVAHGDVLQILQTAFLQKDPSQHRSMEHLETATLRSLESKP